MKEIFIGLGIGAVGIAVIMFFLNLFFIGPMAEERNPKYEACRDAGGAVMSEITKTGENKKLICVERHEIKGIFD